MPAHAMNHFTIADQGCRRDPGFLQRHPRGLKVGYRPPITRPGAWMYAGEQAVLHVIDPIEMPQSSERRARPHGVQRHRPGRRRRQAQEARRGATSSASRARPAPGRCSFSTSTVAKVELNFEKDEPAAQTLKTETARAWRGANGGRETRAGSRE